MPQATIYLNDEDYVKYIARKEELNKKVRELISNEVKEKVEEIKEAE